MRTYQSYFKRFFFVPGRALEGLLAGLPGQLDIAALLLFHAAAHLLTGSFLFHHHAILLKELGGAFTPLLLTSLVGFNPHYQKFHVGLPTRNCNAHSPWPSHSWYRSHCLA
jgi:hypothetical protein